MSDLPLRLHPPLLHFPIAFWIAGTALDLGLSATGIRLPGLDGFSLAHLLLWAGVAAALPTIAAGLADYARLPAAIQDGRLIKLHMLCMSAAFMAFLGAAVWRVKTGGGFAAAPSAAVLVLELLGAAALVIGGHAGGRVVFRELARTGDGQPPPPR